MWDDSAKNVISSKQRWRAPDTTKNYPKFYENLTSTPNTNVQSGTNVACHSDNARVMAGDNERADELNHSQRQEGLA